MSKEYSDKLKYWENRIYNNTQDSFFKLELDNVSIYLNKLKKLDTEREQIRIRDKQLNPPKYNSWLL